MKQTLRGCLCSTTYGTGELRAGSRYLKGRADPCQGGTAASVSHKTKDPRFGNTTPLLNTPPPVRGVGCGGKRPDSTHAQKSRPWITGPAANPARLLNPPQVSVTDSWSFARDKNSKPRCSAQTGRSSPQEARQGLAAGPAGQTALTVTGAPPSTPASVPRVARKSARQHGQGQGLVSRHSNTDTLRRTGRGWGGRSAVRLKCTFSTAARAGRPTETLRSAGRQEAVCRHLVSRQNAQCVFHMWRMWITSWDNPKRGQKCPRVRKLAPQEETACGLVEVTSLA